MDLFPYGMLLWHSAIALGNWLSEDRRRITDSTLLELGCGCGLSGIVASWHGAVVTQSDFNPDVLSLAKLNAQQNGQRRITHRLANWRSWTIGETYDIVIGADLLYEKTSHVDLLNVLQKTVRPSGKAILADPFRQSAGIFLKLAEEAGWVVNTARTNVTWDGETKMIDIHELKLPQA